jgi:hypothetical protein
LGKTQWHSSRAGSVLDLLKKGLEEADKLKFNQQIKEKV